MRRIAFPATAIALLGLVWAGSASTQEAVEQIVHDELGAAPGLQEQALATMEALREEIATLAALRDAQAALLAWNRETSRDKGSPWDSGPLPYLENMKTGTPQRTLSAALCGDPAIGAWCPLLPATFGASHVASEGSAPSGGYTPSGGDREDRHDRD